MIPRKLEEAIIKGWATFQTVSHAFGMFGRLPIADNSIAIITNISWTPFINPIKEQQDEQPLTWREFFWYSEYQLKIDGKKSVNYHIFRNQIDWRLTDNGVINLNDPIDPDIVKQFMYAAPQKPIHVDTYYVCEERIKITISRNVFIDQTLTSFGLLNNKSGEQNSPNGVGNIPVVRRTDMFSPGGADMNYTPPSFEYSGLPNLINIRDRQNYYQDYAPLSGFLLESSLSNFSTDDPIVDISPYLKFPLVTFGMVHINKNDFDKLQNT